MDTLESCVPPGFRFHPTEQELVGYYLKRKINSLKIDLNVIIDIDLYRMEPWDIQVVTERCKQGYDEQSEWYFFSHKDKKYPTGSRTNRATAAGFWKATGRDKAVISKNRIIGMRKTLVFYKGRAPNGRKTDWIMHEYRLQTSQHEPPQEEGWVVCRAFKKPSSNHRQSYETWSHTYYVEPLSPLLPMHSTVHPPSQDFYQESLGNLDQHLLMHNTTGISNHDHRVLEIPQLDSPSTALPTTTLATKVQDYTPNECLEEQRRDGAEQYCIDWKILDDLLNSQLAETASSPTPLLTHNYDQSPQNHVSHLLGCLRDSPLH